MVKINRNIKASTLLETIVAMIIIVIVFTISWVVILNSTKSNNGLQKVFVNQLAENYLNETIQKKELQKSEKKQGDYLLQREIEVFKNDSRILNITVTVFNNSKVELAHQSKLYFLQND
jgi:type II secretory pathway pseudopilin PulG